MEKAIMNYKQFISNQGWIEFNYPSYLINDQEDKGTYLFYTEQTGSCRVTPLQIGGANSNSLEKYFMKLCEKHNGEIYTNGKGHKYLLYVSSSEYEGEDLDIFNWVFTEHDKVVYCSYAISASSINKPEIIQEKSEIDKIIGNFSIG